MLSPESPRKNKLLQLSTFCINHSIILRHPETQKERKTNTYRRSWWRQWNKRKSCGETNFVHIFIPNVHLKKKSEVSTAKTFFPNGFSDYFRFCSKRGTFIHEQRSDRNTQRLYRSVMTHFMPVGALPYITYTGMCRPKGSWFWSSWFRTGYPFQRRFLERGIIFRTHES